MYEEGGSGVFSPLSGMLASESGTLSPKGITLSIAYSRMEIRNHFHQFYCRVAQAKETK